MKITLLQENIRSALNYVSKAVPTKPQLPILNSILLTVTKQGLELAATDLYFGIRTTVYGEVEIEGSIVIPGRTLLESMNSLEAGKVTLETNGRLLQIDSAHSHLEINGQDSQEFPAFPTVDGQELILTLEQLTELDTYVRFSAGIDPTRMILTALLFVFKPDQVLVVGTDGFRLSVLRNDLASELDGTYLIPGKAIAEVCRIMGQNKATQAKLLLSKDLKQALFEVDQTQMFVRLIEGEFPPYEKIMPADYSLEVTWDGGEFEAQIKRAMVFARESSNIVKLSLEKNELVINAVSAVQGKYTGKMPITWVKGEPAQIAFNAKYLQDFLTSVSPQTIFFAMNESLKPALMRPLGMDKYTYIVMPFRVNEGS